MSLSNSCRNILLNDLPVLNALPELDRNPYDYYYADRLARATGQTLLAVLSKYPGDTLRNAENDRIVQNYNARPDVIAQSPKGRPWSDKDWDYVNHKLIYTPEEEVMEQCPTQDISSALTSSPQETSMKAKDILDWLYTIFKRTK